MPDLRKRTEYEQQVTRAVNSVLRDYRRGSQPYDPAQFEADLEQTLTRELTDVHREAIIVLLLLWMQTDSVPLEAVRRYDTLPRELAKATAGSVRNTTTKRLQNAEARAEQVMRKAINTPRADETEQSRAVRKAEREAESILARTRRDVFGRDRAEKISVTSVTTTSSRAEQAASKILAGTGTNVRAFWVTERDSKVCPICRPLHNEPEDNWRWQYPDGPAAHPNCVLAETPVAGTSLVGATRVEYQGPVVAIHLSDGTCFRVTPNHMLLSRWGFLRASDIVNGDDLISTGLVKAMPDGFADSPNNDWEPPLAEQVFDSLAVSGCVSACSVPVAAEYLHGDAAFGNGNVDIVRTHGLLAHDMEPSVSEPANHLQFVFGGNNRRLLSRLGTLAKFLQGSRDATDGGMSVLRERKSVILGKSRHADSIGFASAANSQPNRLEPSDDGVAADTHRLAHLQNAFSGIVSTTKVVSVDRYTLQRPAPVYDFETAETMYLVGSGIVSSNCRCWLRWEPV